MGPGSELPSFGCLASLVYRTNRVNLDSVEQGALDCQEYDKFFGLLERRERLGVQQVRRSVSELLSGHPTGTLATHKALLKLSQVGQGFRLVTTNFDNRFVAAGADENRVTVAPQLPIPKADDWSSIVHLHGRIHQADSDAGSNLVLTAADFGRAYLTERWAARFVTELFRAFTVVFVGYSLQDHVMGYLVDALAESGSYRQAYAFAAHDGTERGRESTETEWRAKNVTPIVYACCDGHRLLTKTLEAWAEIKSDPFRSRERIVLDGMREFPNPSHAGRVTWALQDPTTAKKLAGAPPLADPVDCPKLEQWLDKFDGAGLFGRPALNSGDSSVSLVSSNQTPTSLDAATWHMARWMAGHLHVPQLLTWVLKKGGALHPGESTDESDESTASAQTSLGHPGGGITSRSESVFLHPGASEGCIGRRAAAHRRTCCRKHCAATRRSSRSSSVHRSTARIAR